MDLSPILINENRHEYSDTQNLSTACSSLSSKQGILNFSSMSWLQCIKSILTIEHAGNTEIYNVGLILVSFSQPVSDDLCEEVKTRRASY